MREQLIASFSNIDIEGIGRVNRYKLADIVREVPVCAYVACLNITHLSFVSGLLPH